MAVALLLFFLPIEVLFRLNAWILFMPAWDLVAEVAMMILLLALASAGLAVLIAAATSALSAWPSRKVPDKIEDRIAAVGAIGALAVIVFVLLSGLRSWLQATAGLDLSIGTADITFLFFPLAFACALVWAKKYGLLRAGALIHSKLDRGSRAVVALILCSGLVVGVNGITLHDYRGIKANPIPAPRPDMPNVILLSIDTLTAEDMSLYGYPLPTTPKLEAFSKVSYVFDNFFSSSNWTKPTVASFISGLDPTTHGVNLDDSYFLEKDRKKNLGQALQDNGYQTAAIVANVNANPLYDRIPDSFSAATEPPANYSPIIGYRLKNYRTTKWLSQVEMLSTPIRLLAYLRTIPSFGDRQAGSDENVPVPASAVFDRSIPLLASLKQPNFVWAHIFPPHSPYLPSAPFKYKFGSVDVALPLQDEAQEYSPEQQSVVDQKRLRYDEFILDTDSRVGVFLDRLKAMGRFDDSIIIITSDHGESFTRNYLGHGGPHLHQPLIHIPLMIHLPGQQAGKRIPFYAAQVDLLSTVMDLLDLPIPEWAEGESLKAAMLESTPTLMPKFSMILQESRFVAPQKGTVAVMHDGWKLVCYLATRKEELYHLAVDPQERANLININPGEAGKLRELIYARFKLDK